MTKSKRFLVLANPQGYLTCVEPSNTYLIEKYKSWEILAKVNRPLTDPLVRFTQLWAIKTFRL